MADFWSHPYTTFITIPEVEDAAGPATFYKITIVVNDDVRWSVSRRYSEFLDMHNVLVKENGIERDSLPPKRAMFNKCPQFIESRRASLENYLQELFAFLRVFMPKAFVEFLRFHVYERFFLLQNLANNFFNDADTILQTVSTFAFEPLQLYAISQGFRNPTPQVDYTDPKNDFSHVLDFCGELKKVIINGSNEPHLESNLIPNHLIFDFCAFKGCKELEISNYALTNVPSFGNLRHGLERMCINKSKICSISQILQSDIIHKNIIEDCHMWDRMRLLDLNNNSLTEIDNCICLVPNLETLLLNNNQLRAVPNLMCLKHLKHVHLASNLISSVDDVQSKLTQQVLTLNLAENCISAVLGFAELAALESLDLSFNRICGMEGFDRFDNMQKLVALNLLGNLVERNEIDFRIKMLRCFANRANEVCLDNEMATQQEIDRVQLMMAIQKANLFP